MAAVSLIYVNDEIYYDYYPVPSDFIPKNDKPPVPVPDAPPPPPCDVFIIMEPVFWNLLVEEPRTALC